MFIFKKKHYSSTKFTAVRNGSDEVNNRRHYYASLLALCNLSFVSKYILVMGFKIHGTDVVFFVAIVQLLRSTKFLFFVRLYMVVDINHDREKLKRDTTCSCSIMDKIRYPRHSDAQPGPLQTSKMGRVATIIAKLSILDAFVFSL